MPYRGAHYDQAKQHYLLKYVQGRQIDGVETRLSHGAHGEE